MNLASIYIGEHLWPGHLGHALIITSFLSALFAMLSFGASANKDSDSWKTLGRGGFYIHGVSTISLIALIFYMMIAKMYEYRYVFEHVSDDLPLQYILSAFWEGQEGSFMLWMFWHIILGGVIIHKKYKLEAPTMATLMAVEVFISSMLLGLIIGGEDGFKLGSNPMLLLRETMNAPLFSNPEYVSMIKGSGLNPLLQNYWNVIHPPVLFLGFASLTIPFAFAIAGLWKKAHKEWLQPALHWGLFAASIFGTGILMGGMWAYVALSFGGYWAWDPVENMSLVPWLVLVGGIHTNLIAKATGYSIKSTYLMYLLSFVLVLYSTFMTRSGILGETSAHAFTEMGLEWQLVAFVGFFFLASLVFYFSRSRQIPAPKKEESIYSREFWMFIGSIVLLFSGLIIAGSTSLPVFNKIASYFDPEFVGKVIEDPIPHYNKYQIWVACFITLLSSVSLWLKFKGFGWEKTKKKFVLYNLLFVALAGVISYLMSFWISFYEGRYWTLNIFCVYAILTNLYLLFPNNWKSTKSLAAATSHLGFAIMIVGTLASGLNEKVITTNPFALSGLVEDEDLAKVITLIKGEPFFSNNYWITYESDTIIDRTRHFHVDFKQVDTTGKVIEQFVVKPNVLFSNDMTKVAAPNPATKRYLTKDIFTNVPSLPAAQRDIKLAQEEEDSLKYQLYEVEIGDTIYLSKGYVIVDGINVNPQSEAYNKENNELGMEMLLTGVPMKGDSIYQMRPALGLEKNLIYTYPDRNNQMKIKAKLKDEYFEEYFSSDENLDYQIIKIKRGESFKFQDWNIEMVGLNMQPTHPNYERQEKDIAVAAKLELSNSNLNLNYNAAPIYLIRDSKPLVIKEYFKEPGLHVQLASINPKSEEFTFRVALDRRNKTNIPLLLAEDVPRSDWILLEAVVFPGINLFWFGSIFMMIGFALSLSARFKSKL